MLASLRPRNWWQAGLMWGTAMLIYSAIRQAFEGKLTPAMAGRDLLIWEAGGLLFGVLLTGALSLFAQKNLFHGFPDKRRDDR